METLLSLPIPSSSTAKDWVPAEEREGGEGRVNILRAFFFFKSVYLSICLLFFRSLLLYLFVWVLSLDQVCLCFAFFLCFL